jgi:hypothetical protein
MPLSPFLGLSFLIHISIIIWYKLFGWLPFNANSTKTQYILFKVVSCVLILFVSAITCLSAYRILYTSVTEKHSSIYFVNKQFSSAIAYASKRFSSKDVATILTTPEIISAAAPPVNCAEAFKKLSREYKGSIILYLISKHIPSRLDNRISLSKKVGIDGYRGTRAQNSELLKRMAIQEGDIPTECSENQQ